MSGWAGLNRRPFGPEPNALPTALQPDWCRGGCRGGDKRAGATGLEPAASGLTGQRDNQLRHAPVTVNVPAARRHCQGPPLSGAPGELSLTLRRAAW